MKDVKEMVKVGKLVKSIQSDMRWAEKNKQDAYSTLGELNSILTSNGGEPLQMEEVLQIVDEE